GLPDNFRRAGLLADAGSGFDAIGGPGVVLSGSCSTASNAQVAEYLQTQPGLAVTASGLMDGQITVDDALGFVRAQADQNPIVYSTAEPADVQAVQTRYGREAVTRRIEHFFADLSVGLVADGVTRLVV